MDKTVITLTMPRTLSLQRMLLVFLLFFLSTLPAWGATRLGLLVTQEELDLWRIRMTDNVTTINDFTYASIYQNRLLAHANSFQAQSHPGGDGYWAGYTGAGCAPKEGGTYAGTGGTPWSNGNGGYLMRTALVYLLTGDVSYAAPVRTELLALTNPTTTPGADFGNTAKWCRDGSSYGSTARVYVNPWLIRVALAYDMLLASGYPALTASDKTQINAWLMNAATWFRDLHLYGIAQGHYGYSGIFEEPQNFTCTGYCTNAENPWYYGGPTSYAATRYTFFGQPAYAMLTAAIVGVQQNNTALQTYAKKFFYAYLRAGTLDNGAQFDIARWQDCPGTCPGSAWGHQGGAMASLVLTADIFARAGDVSLYDYAIATEVLGGSGGTVRLDTSLVFMATLASKAPARYTYSGSTQLKAISWDTEAPPQVDWWDQASMAANLYYNNATIHTAMNRVSPMANSNLGGVGCRDAQMAGCFAGGGGFWPDLPFMYGNMEGQVNPYSLATSAAPTLSLASPTTYASITVSGSTLTLSGPASDDIGVAAVTWTRTAPVGSGSATCAPACGGGTPPTSTTWTITNLELPADGQSTTVTITVSDGDDPAQTAQVVLTVTRQDTPDITSNRLLWLQLNDGSGPTAADSSGASPPNTGTLQGGATWGSGHSGGGISLDGIDDAISLTSDLGQPSTLTLALWAQVGVGADAWATLVNLGNSVGLRVDEVATTRLIHSFWYDGATYPNLVSTTAFPGAGWHHVALTMSASRQVLYLDGVVVAMGAGVAPNYSTSTNTGMIGRHVSVDWWDLQGAVDDVRVYGRALSEVDITALLAGEALSLYITEPTSASTYERTTSPLITLSGSAYGVEVTVTWACPGCPGSPSGQATLTPPSWTVADIPLTVGNGNVITVTATDGTLATAQDVLTVTYSPPQTTLAAPFRLRLSR